MEDHDSLIRQLGAGIELGDRRVVPLLDLAEIDLGKRRAVDHEVARLDAFEVDDRHDAAHHHRELHQTVLFKLVALKRRVARPERYGLGLYLLTATARTNRLIAQSEHSIVYINNHTV